MQEHHLKGINKDDSIHCCMKGTTPMILLLNWLGQAQKKIKHEGDKTQKERAGTLLKQHRINLKR